MKKHILLIGITLSILLLSISATCYSGGSQHDKNAIGYDLRHNYLCNLFNEKAVNGADNTASRIWAIGGMFCLCASLALFFVRFSEKMSHATSAKIIKYCGLGSMFFAFLVIIFHDLMTTLSSIAALLALFYMTAAIFKSKQTLFKWLSGLCLAILYLNNYIYYTQHLLEYLAILQKVSFLLVFALILGLDYFTEKEDFVS